MRKGEGGGGVSGGYGGQGKEEVPRASRRAAEEVSSKTLGLFLIIDVFITLCKKRTWFQDMIKVSIFCINAYDLSPGRVIVHVIFRVVTLVLDYACGLPEF